MGLAHGLHWIGVFLLFAASVLLLITTISAPVINDVGLLKVNLPSGSTLSFGTFGYCVLNNNADDDCTGSHIGYNPAQVIGQALHTSFETIAGSTSDDLTKVMILHPIACGIAFLAFLLCASHHMVGSFIGAMVAFVAWVLALVSLAVDFTLFGIIHHHVNDDFPGNDAFYAAGMWTLVGAFVALFFGMFIVFITCCAARRDKKRSVRSVDEKPVRSGRRWPWSRRRAAY